MCIARSGITAAMNRKRQIFTGINPTDDVDLAYRSTSNYLRQLAQQGSIPSDEMLIAGNVPRTRSASELTMRNNRKRDDIYRRIHRGYSL